MQDFIKKLLPIVFSFFLGILLRKIRLFHKEDGDRFLKLVFYITLPALILEAFSTLDLSLNFIFLPLIASIVFFSVFGVSFALGKKLRLSKRTFGTFLLGSMIMNTGFSLPFFQAAWGGDGVLRVTMFDLGNNFLIFTFAFFIAMQFGDSKDNDSISWKKFFYLPPVWAVLIGLLINFSNFAVPIHITRIFSTIGNSTMFLLMISLGLYFSPKIRNFKHTFLVLFLRMGLGFFVGFLLTKIFPLDEISQKIVIISSGAPVGYNTLIFSTIENLDKEFAAGVVSLSIFIGIFYIPLLIYFL